MIIALSGKKESGKDFACKILRALLPPPTFRLAFADSLKEEVARATGHSVEYIEENKKQFRLLLQWWGTEFRRDMYHQYYWIHKWNARRKGIIEHCRQPNPIFIVPDVRFSNEIATLKELDAIFWCIIAKNKPEEVTEVDPHLSEKSLPYPYDAILENDFENPEKLVESIKQEVQKIKLKELV